MSKVTDILTTISDRIASLGKSGGGALDSILSRLGGQDKKYGGGAAEHLADVQQRLASAEASFKASQKSLSTTGADLQAARASGNASEIKKQEQAYEQSKKDMLASRQSLVAARKPVAAAQKEASFESGIFGKMHGAGKLLGDLGLGGGKVGQGIDLAVTGGRALAGDPTAIVELAKKGIQDVQQRIEHVKDAGKQVVSAAQTQDFGKIGGRMMGAGESIGKSMQPFGMPIGPTGPMGFAIEQVSKFGRIVFETIDKLKEFGESLHGANMQFAQFSGAMAGVKARQEVRDIQLSRERGDRRAESAEYLAKGKSRFARAVAPVEDAWGRIWNNVAGWGLDKVGAGVEGVLGIAEKFPGVKALLERNKEKNESDVGDFFRRTRNPSWVDQGQPERFRG